MLLTDQYIGSKIMHENKNMAIIKVKVMVTSRVRETSSGRDPHLAVGAGWHSFGLGNSSFCTILRLPDPFIHKEK